MRYALMRNETVVRYQHFDAAPDTLNPSKGLSWVPAPEPAVEPESLESIKARKNSEINAARLAANMNTFTHAGKVVACDSLSRGDIEAVNGIVALTNSMPSGWVGGWKSVDNSIIPISTVADWIAFYGSMVAQGMSNFAHSQALKAQLDAAYVAQDRNAMEAITW